MQFKMIAYAGKQCRSFEKLQFYVNLLTAENETKRIKRHIFVSGT